MAINRRIDVKSYTSLATLVHDMFPPTSLIEQVIHWFCTLSLRCDHQFRKVLPSCNLHPISFSGQIDADVVVFICCHISATPISIRSKMEKSCENCKNCKVRVLHTDYPFPFQEIAPLCFCDAKSVIRNLACVQEDYNSWNYWKMPLADVDNL